MAVGGLAAAGCGAAASSTAQSSPTSKGSSAPSSASSTNVRSAANSGSARAGYTHWPITEIAAWPKSDTQGSKSSLAWSAHLLVSGQLVFASHTCANAVPLCKHASPQLEVVDTNTHQTLAASQRYSILAVGDCGQPTR